MNRREFCKTINDYARTGNLVKITHHLLGSHLVWQAETSSVDKRKVYVRDRNNMLFFIDPILWEITPTNERWK